MTTKEKQFIKEIAQVCRKHGVKVGHGDHYNSEENYQGTTFYFYGEEINCVELGDIQDQLLNKKG